jgi:hypothetical protein
MIVDIQIWRYNIDVALLYRENTLDCYCDCLKDTFDDTLASFTCFDDISC